MWSFERCVFTRQEVSDGGKKMLLSSIVESVGFRAFGALETTFVEVHS